MDCVFCKIVSGEINAKVVLDNEFCLAFHDLQPVAPTHILVIPKKHVDALASASEADALQQLLLSCAEVARGANLADGYRVVMNNGPAAGQSVSHLHAHVLGGRNLAWPPG